jgi:hypothetical protein
VADADYDDFMLLTAGAAEKAHAKGPEARLPPVMTGGQ